MPDFLRFPNPGSDFVKFVTTYQAVADALKGEERFDLDDAVRVVVRAGQASSSGAVGEEALRRSTRDDRSRDPLYNQLKMYTEIYRMLGWIHPVDKKLAFCVTDLGAHIAGAYGTGDLQVASLIQECLLSISFPNPNTTGKGVANARPFLTFLRFFEALGGVASRDELIVGVYTLSDDTDARAFEQNVARVAALRGRDPEALCRMLEKVAGGIQTNTLKNYTRFPLGALKSPLVGWAQPEAADDVYAERVLMYRLTEAGYRFLQDHAHLRDVRAGELAKATQAERAHFLVLSHYVMYERTGLDLIAAGVDLAPHIAGCAGLLKRLKIEDPRSILFSPFQQAEHGDIKHAMALA